MYKLLLSVALMGCQAGIDYDSVQPTSRLYQKAMVFSINGQTIDGFGVTESRIYYDLILNLPKNTSVLLFSTCHGDEVVRNPPEYFTWKFRPTLFLEKPRRCPLQIKAIEKNGFETYGEVFLPTDETLSATVYCNRDVTKFEKVSVCQASARDSNQKVQQIVFYEPVEGYAHPDCPELMKVSPYRYEYNMAPGTCAYKFVSMVNSKRTHRHLTYGFTHFTFEQELSR